MSSLLVHGGRIVGGAGITPGDVWIVDGRIAAVGPGLALPPGTAAERIDATGQLVFPGVIDTQVHFREPGMPDKEDLASGSLAAVAGGVTSFLEMPNTNPATVDPEALADKLRRAAGRAHADHAFFLGATGDNADRLGEWEQLPGCAGVKMFMGSSTGTLLVADDVTAERVLRSGSRRMAVHSEDEYRLQQRYAALAEGTPVTAHPEVRDVECAVRCTTRLLDLVEKTGRRVHILHVSTAEEVALVRQRDLGDLVTCEVTPNHLFMAAPDCYETFGSRAQMNPPVRDRRHRDALRAALAEGFFACVGSDHAPHTAAEKDRPYPRSPSGIPGVQTILPLLLTAVRDGWLTLGEVLRVTSSGPAAVYGIAGKGAIAPGMDGDLTLVDPDETRQLPLEWLRSRAGYSPYVGTPLNGWPHTTILRGAVVYREHMAVGAAIGRPVSFAGG